MTDQNPEKFNSWLANNLRPALFASVVLFVGCLFIEMVPGEYFSSALAFIALGFVSLYLMPYVFGLPSGRKSLREYCYDIRLLPMSPVGRNVGIGLLMAALTLSSILAASLLTGHFVLDWGEVSPIRLIKGLTRGIWEEVFFRGIILVILMRMFPFRKAVFMATLIFALAHLGGFSLEVFVDVISVFFMGLLFIYLVLKTGSLLPAIVFHYVHDIFLKLVLKTPEGDGTMKLVMLYGFLWIALIIGGFLTKFIVERRPDQAVHPQPSDNVL